MENKLKYSSLLKGAAICSFLGAITTTLLFILPTPTGVDFESSTLLYTNKLYLGRLWVLFIHPQVNILAIIGLAILLYRKYPLQIVFGSVFLFFWAYTEMSQQALLIDALNQIWRPGYVEASDEVSKNMFSTLIKVANGISDSNYFLVIYGFGMGSLLFGTALIREQTLGKWIGVACIFIGVLSLASFLRYYLGLNFLNDIVNWCYKWIYSILQPLVRIAIGIWILNEIKVKES